MKVATSEDVLPLEALYADIYANTPAQHIRGVTADTSLTQPYTTTVDLLKKMGRESRRVTGESAPAAIH